MVFNESLLIRITKEMKESLQDLAKADRRKLADYCRNVLEDHIINQKKLKPGGKDNK